MHKTNCYDTKINTTMDTIFIFLFAILHICRLESPQYAEHVGINTMICRQQLATILNETLNFGMQWTAMSEKMGNFERLAERRVNDAIKKLRLIGNLANRRNYEYTDKHAKKIVDVLEAELRILKAKFREEECEGGLFSFGHKEL
jgi:hypothetical protein